MRCQGYFFKIALGTRLAKRMLYSEQPTVLLARRHLNTMLLTNFENLNSISYIIQEAHNFLVLRNPVIICLYLRTSDRHFRDQGNDRHPTSKLLKCELVQTLNTFWNPSLRIFAAGKASLVPSKILLQFHKYVRAKPAIFTYLIFTLYLQFYK